MKISAGLLMYKIKEGRPEVLLVHPGGPFFKNKDNGVWSIPKGEAEEGEDLLLTAKREFVEETGIRIEPEISKEKFIELNPVKRPGKVVHTWAFLGDADPAKIKSNLCSIEWPPRSGKMIEIPEVDKADFFSLDEAQIKLYPYLAPLILDFSQRL